MMNLKIITKKELFKFAKTVKPHLVVNLSYADQQLGRNVLLLDYELEDLIAMPETEVFVFGNRKTALIPILEKAYLRYVAVMIKVKLTDIIERFNKSQEFNNILYDTYGYDPLMLAEDHIFLRFRVSVDSTHERANIGFCKRFFTEHFTDIYELLTKSV